MVVLRHVSREGSPAYLTYWKRALAGHWEFLRLAYKGAPSFETDWARGVDALPE